MTVLGQAVVRVVPDARGFDQELEAEVERPVAGTAAKITALLGGAFALSKAKDFFVDAIGAASDLGEETSKTSVVFGEASDSVLAFADDAADSLGQSKQQALGAAGTFGNLLRSLQLNEAQAAEMSTTMVGLASDLASFNNADVSETLDALRAGLVGETEPLKRFGVNLNEARITAEALSLGLASTKDEIDGAAKAQAVYSLILKDTTLAQGDFARTSDGLANTQRILTAQWEDAKAEVGEGLLPLALQLATVAKDDLLPAFTDLATAAVPLIVRAFEVANPLLGSGVTILEAMAPALNVVADVLEAIPDPVLQLAALSYTANRGIGGIVTTTSNLTERLRGLSTIDWSGNLTGPASGATSALSKVNVAALGVTAAVAAGVYIYGEATKASKEYARQVEDLGEQLQDVTSGQAQLNDVVRDFLESEFDPDMVEVLNAFGLSFQDLERAISSGGDVLDPFREKVAELGVDLNGIDFGNLDNGVNELSAGALANLAEATGVNIGQLRDLIDQIEDFDNATQDAAKAELDRLVATEAITAAQRDQFIQQATGRNETENYAGALNLAKDATGQLADEADGAAGASSDLAGAMGDVSGEAETQAERLQRLNDEMDTLLDAILEAAGSELDYQEAVQRSGEGLEDLVKAELELLAARGPDGRRAVRDAELELAEAHREYQRVAEDTESTELDLARAADAVRDAEDKVTEAKQADEEATDALNEALRDAERDTMRQAEAAVQLAEKTAAAEGKTLSWQDKNRILRDELAKVRDTLAPGSPLYQNLSQTIAQLDSVPGTYTAKVVADTDDAMVRLDRLARALNDLGTTPVRISVGGGGGVPLGAAHGYMGTVGGGTPLVIGEGPNPEDVLVVPQSLGGLDRVIGELARSIAGSDGGGDTVQLVLPPGLRENTAVAVGVAAVEELRASKFRRGKK